MVVVGGIAGAIVVGGIAGAFMAGGATGADISGGASATGAGDDEFNDDESAALDTAESGAVASASVVSGIAPSAGVGPKPT